MVCCRCCLLRCLELLLVLLLELGQLGCMLLLLPLQCGLQLLHLLLQGHLVPAGTHAW
jgi:hypothetical protein